MKKEPLIILTGPTAVGKTELSIELAKILILLLKRLQVCHVKRL